MKPRPAALVIPEGSRQHFCVALGEKGQHHFKAPYYGVGGAVLALAAKYYVDPKTDTRTAQAKTEHMLPFMGAVIGACWRHRGLDLETPTPKDLSVASLTAYGVTVTEEMQDADYDLLHLMELFNQVLPEVAKRQSILAMAEERAGFSVPPKEDSISS